MKVDLIKLEEQMALGNVGFQTHPQLPLRIFKYSKQAVYSQAWNDITTICRGLVLDGEGNVVVNSMPKFYNSNQAEVQAVLKRTENLVYEVFDKMDGSLLQVAKWNGNLIITSSGSFDSPQVHKATEMLSTSPKYSRYNFQDGFTYIFEIIYPENRIVLNYGDKESLTLLAIRETATGQEVSYEEISKNFALAWDVVEKINKTIPEILAELPHDSFINKEGYVVKFANGDRVKYKFDKYCTLHKAISGVSSKWIWECLRDGIDTKQALVEVPDELFDWVEAEKMKFNTAFNERLQHVGALCSEIRKVTEVRKEQAALILSKHKLDAKLLFGLLDSRDIAKMIWNELEPSGALTMRWGAGASADEE